MTYSAHAESTKEGLGDRLRCKEDRCISFEDHYQDNIMHYAANTLQTTSLAQVSCISSKAYSYMFTTDPQIQANLFGC
jgi:hypothetical protein